MSELTNLQVKPTLDQKLQMVDAGSLLVQRDLSLEQELNFRETKAQLIAQVRANVKAKTGKDLSLEDATQIAGHYYKQQTQHENPLLSSGSFVYGAYIARRKIGIATATLAAIVGLATGVGIGIDQAIKAQQLKKQNAEITFVQSLVNERTQKISNLTQSYSRVEVDAVESKMPTEELAQVRSISGSSKTELASMSRLLSGQIGPELKYTNLAKAREAMGTVDATLQRSNGQLQQAESIVKLQQNLNTSQSGLNANFKYFSAADLPNSAKEIAKNTYQTGLAAIAARDLAMANSSNNKLVSLRSGYKNLKPDYDAIVRFANNIKHVSKISSPISEANSALDTAKTYLDNADFEHLGKLKEDMSDLEFAINSEYALIIPNQPKSYVQRTFTPFLKDKNGNLIRDRNGNPIRGTGSVSGHYVGMTAVARNGDKLEIKITSEETNEIKKVKYWLEKVPRDVFEKVKTDKQDGIVNDNKFGYKERGYLEPKLNMIPKRTGQLTEY